MGYRPLVFQSLRAKKGLLRIYPCVTIVPMKTYSAPELHPDLINVLTRLSEDFRLLDQLRQAGHFSVCVDYAETEINDTTTNTVVTKTDD